MPATYARVGEQLAKGKNITEATKEGMGDAESSALADRDEDYNTRYASYRGYVMAYERTKPIPRHTADLSLTTMVATANAKTVDEVVDHFLRAVPQRRARAEGPGRARRLPARQAGRRRASAASEELEPALRELLYLVLSTPEYQLG